jgi:hypothetical protein
LLDKGYISRALLLGVALLSLSRRKMVAWECV